MKLAHTVLCLTCDEMFNDDEYKACPSCTDKYPLRLLPILKPIKEMLEDRPNDKEPIITYDRTL